MKVAFFAIYAVFIILIRGLTFAIIEGFKRLSESDKRGFSRYSIKNHSFTLGTKQVEK
jgi:hypothetical protein